MRATKMVKQVEVGGRGAAHRRARGHADLARPRRARRLHEGSREATVRVEMADYEARLAGDPSMARRMRARMRRVVRGAALRYGGEVVREAGSEIELLFATGLDGALAAAHARAGLSGDRGVAAKIVVHQSDTGGTTGRAAARDLARAGDVLLLGRLGSRLAPFAQLHTRFLGKFMIAGVSRPTLVTALEAGDEDAGAVAAWSAPWMARLARRGAAPSGPRSPQK